MTGVDAEADGAMGEGLLEGIAVVELGESPAIGFAGRVLAELGAAVTMLEPPHGTALREAPPFTADGSGLFEFLSAGKEVRFSSDLEPDEIATANLVLHDRVDPSLRAKIEEADLPTGGQAMVACTPYGCSGPKRDWRATELTLFHGGGEGWVMPSGLAYEEFPERPPIRIAHYVANYQAGLTAGLVALAALRRSRLRGATEVVDVSAQEAEISLNFMGISRFFDGSLETRANRAFRYGGVLPCRDGHIEILTIEQKQWHALRRGLGDPDWARDPALEDPVERAEHGAAINIHLREWARERTVAEAVAELRGADVPCGAFVAPEDLPDTTQMRERSFFARDASGRAVPGRGWKLTPAPPLTRSASSRVPPGSLTSKDRPLAGIRIVDFTSHASGPYCVEMLALLGCEVIRIESAAHLDINRRTHPVYGRLNVPTFDHLAGHKKSVTLNLKTPGGVGLAKDLIQISDVVIENFRPGVMERLGLAWDELSDLNSDLVMLSLSANGQTGPEARLPGYAPVFAAEGGLGFMTGYRDSSPGELRNNMDHMAGLMSATVAVAMCTSRERSGAGCYADVSAREVAAMFVGESILAGRHKPSTRVGNDHQRWCPHGVYPAAGENRWVAIAVTDDDDWARLRALLPDPDLDRLADEESRRADRRLVDERIGEWTAGQDARELVDTLQAHGIAAEVSMSAADIASDPHLAARGAFVDLVHPTLGGRRTVEAPWRFEGIEQSYVGWSPALGEHNESVLGGLLGLGRDDLDRLRGEEVVF